mgnify:CR=1 FL=1
MKRSRFTEEQIIAVLREQEAGVAKAEICRKYSISSATFYAWKEKFGGRASSSCRRSSMKSLVRLAFRNPILPKTSPMTIQLHHLVGHAPTTNNN